MKLEDVNWDALLQQRKEYLRFLRYADRIEFNAFKKQKFACKDHKWVSQHDLIDVEIIYKKSPKIVKKCPYCWQYIIETRKEAAEERRKQNAYDKKNLTNYYVMRNILKGTKLSPDDIPDSLLETQRAALKIKKLSGIVVECKKHGKLKLAQCIKHNKKKNGDYSYRCKACMKELHAKHYEKNKDKLKPIHAKWREENKDRKRELNRKWYRENIGKAREQNRLKEQKARELFKEKVQKRKNKSKIKQTEQLGDSYIIHLLKKGTNLKAHEIPQPLIKLKKEIVSLKREIKDTQQKKRLLTLQEKINVINQKNEEASA